MTNEIIVTTRSQLTREIQDALRPVLANATNACEVALGIARDRVNVAAEVYIDNLKLRAALVALLADTQHVHHKCGDDDCPVLMAQRALAGPVRQ